MYCKVSRSYRSLLYPLILLRYQCDLSYFTMWPYANPYINEQLKKKQKTFIACFLKNVNFRLNTLLHGALPIFRMDWYNTLYALTSYVALAFLTLLIIGAATVLLVSAGCSDLRLGFRCRKFLRKLFSRRG